MGDQLIVDLQVEKTTSTKKSWETLEKLSREGDELEEKMKILKDENENLSRRRHEERSICRNQLESLAKGAFRHHQAKYDDSSIGGEMSRLTEDKLLATRKGFEEANSSRAEDSKLIVFRDEPDLDGENDRLRLELKKTQIERQQLVAELSQWKEASRLDETHSRTGTMGAPTTGNVQVEEKMQILKEENSALHNKSQHLEGQLFFLREKVNELARSDVNLKTEKEKLENELENLKRELDLSKTARRIEFEKQRSDDEKYSESEKEITSHRKLEAKNTLRKLIQRSNRVENDSAVHETRHESRVVQSGKNVDTNDVKYVKILEIELTRMQDENANLKNQSEELRNNILSLKEEQTKLKSDNEEIASISEIHQEINCILKKQLANFIKENDRLEITKLKLDHLDPKLRTFYKDYVTLKKSLETALDEIHHLKEYNANLIKMQNFLDNSGSC